MAQIIGTIGVFKTVDQFLRLVVAIVALLFLFGMIAVIEKKDHQL